MKIPRAAALSILASLGLLSFMAPAKAAVTLSCHLIASEEHHFTMTVDADAQTVLVKGAFGERTEGVWDRRVSVWIGERFYPAGSKRPDSYRGRDHEVVFGEHYIDLLLNPQGDFGFRLDRETLKLLPIGDASSRKAWVAEGSSCRRLAV